MTFKEKLGHNLPLQKRMNASEVERREITKKFNEWESLFGQKPITVYCAGSLGRGEIGSLSDLDLFILSDEEEKSRSKLRQLELLAAIIKINRDLEYNDFSNDGEYLKVYYKDHMLKSVGRPQDDSENLFTARMLLLLESKPVLNTAAYDILVNDVIHHYFRDSEDKNAFKPLFLINDILRYWRTLCLNYEQIRNDVTRSWRKKNINLKFSRMLTVFATILPLIAEPATNEDSVRKLVQLTPHERLAFGLDLLNDESLIDSYVSFLDNYESFLSWKEHSDPKIDDKFQENADAVSINFSGFLHTALTHRNISSEYKKYLIL